MGPGNRAPEAVTKTTVAMKLGRFTRFVVSYPIYMPFWPGIGRQFLLCASGGRLSVVGLREGRLMVLILLGETVSFLSEGR